MGSWGYGTEPSGQVTGTGSRPGCWRRSQPPTCLRYSATSPCCTATPHESRWRTQSWGPVRGWTVSQRGNPLPGASVLATSPGPTHLHDGINRAGLLTETAVDTLGHVDVIACGPAAAIGSWLSLDGDGLREWPQVTATLAGTSWPCPSQLNLAPGGSAWMPHILRPLLALQGSHLSNGPISLARLLLSTCPGDPPVSQGRGYDLL